jgi:hypothetical protein
MGTGDVVVILSAFGWDRVFCLSSVRFYKPSSQYTQLGMSAPWLLPFGLNFTAAYVLRHFQGETRYARTAAGNTAENANYYFKIGNIWPG